MPTPYVLVASHLDEGELARLRRIVAGKLDVIHRPALIPVPRFRGDHVGELFVRSPHQADEWTELLRGAQILWDLPHQDQSAQIFGQLETLRWVQSTNALVATQVDRLQVPSDVLITTAYGIHGSPLAEFVILGLLMHFKKVAHLFEEQRRKRWMRHASEELHGKTIVILGAGSLGRATANLARAHGMRPIIITRDPERHRRDAGEIQELAAFDQLHRFLPQAHALIITLPDTPDTHGFVDAGMLASLKTGGALVNIGRGAVLDQDALMAALRSGQVGFAALDVATPEPLPADHPLWSMNNVLISPHSASLVPGENQRLLDIFEFNFSCWTQGRSHDMRNLFDRGN